MTKDEQKIVDEVRESQSREAWFSEKVAELEALSDNFRKWATQNDVPQNITGGDRGWLIATQTVEGSRAEIVYDHRFPIHHPTRTFTHWMVPDQPAGRSPYTTVPTIEGFTVETVTIEDPINDRIHGPYGHGRCLTLPQQPDDSFFLNARDILEDGIAGWLADRPDAPWPPAS